MHAPWRRVTRSVAVGAVALPVVGGCSDRGSGSGSGTPTSEAQVEAAVASTRTTFTLDETLAERARQLGVNISAAARDGVAAAVRAALVRADRAAYERHPERADPFWAEVEAWGEE